MITIDDKNNFMIFSIFEHIYNHNCSPLKGIPACPDEYRG